MVEIYVNDVTRWLPEDERVEVGAEVKSKINDMLTDESNAAEVKAVLQKMGSPISIARRYHDIPNSLRPPSAFRSFLESTKIIIPLIGAIFIVFCILMRAIGSFYKPMSASDIFIAGILEGAKFTALIVLFMATGYIISSIATIKKRGF